MPEGLPVEEPRPGSAPNSDQKPERSPLPVEEAPSLAATPATLKRGVCVWLTSGQTSLLREIGPELCERLRAQLREVELLPHFDEEDKKAPPRLDPSDVVGYLADGAASLVRHGVTVVVAHPLADTADRTIVRERVERIVEVYIRATSGPLRGPEGIPVIYRWMSDGRIEEREVPSVSASLADRPDVIVDGTLGPPSEVAGDILDVLERAGWITPAGGELPEAPVPPTPVPLAALPSTRN